MNILSSFKGRQNQSALTYDGIDNVWGRLYYVLIISLVLNESQMNQPLAGMI